MSTNPRPVQTASRQGPLTFGPACCEQPFDHQPSDHMTYAEAAVIVAAIQRRRGW
jgi:hypothetical protein